MEITRETLLTVGGIALVTAIALQLWIKPWLTKRHKEAWWHDLALNVSATVLAIGLAFVGLYVGLIPSDGPAMAFAAVQGIVAAFAAVYGYETYKNVRKYVGRQE